MATPKTVEQLVREHRDRVYSIVMETLDRFEALPEPKAKHNFASFVTINSSKLFLAMNDSLFEAVSEGIKNKISIDDDFVEALRKANRDGILVWQQEYNRVHNDLPL